MGSEGGGEIGLRWKLKEKEFDDRKTMDFLLNLFRSLSNIWTERLSYKTHAVLLKE
jgi:hypothetical protein